MRCRGLQTEIEKDDFKETWDEFILNYNTLVYQEAGFRKRVALHLQSITFSIICLRNIHSKITICVTIIFYMIYLGGCVVNLLDRPASDFNIYSGLAVSCTSLVTAINGLLLIVGPKVPAMYTVIVQGLTYCLLDLDWY